MDLQQQPVQFEVSDWKSEPPLLVDNNQIPSDMPSAVIGLAVSIALHLILLYAALFGGHSPVDISPQVTTTNEKVVPGDLTHVAVEASVSSGFAVSVASPLISTEKLIRDLKREPLPIIDLDPLSIEEETIQSSETTAGNALEPQRGRLLGIYSGQMKARIERQWRRPRTPIDEGMGKANSPGKEFFSCVVNIVQDDTGNVQEILLPYCNGSTAWQRSLVLAIQQASPLPAPSDTSVFSRAVTLTFTAFPYMAGASLDEYETAEGPILRSH